MTTLFLDSAKKQLVMTGNQEEKFYSYGSLIVIKKSNKVSLTNLYDYSKTTMKYLNKFLGTSSISEVRKNIKSGNYSLME